MKAVGADGCRAGWLAVEVGGGAAIFPRLAELLDAFPLAMIVVDTPIGLPSGWTERRETDAAARALLSSRNRTGLRSVGSRIFPAPPRPALALWREGADQGTVNRAAEGPRLSVQSYNILDKIDDADRTATPEIQDHLCEGHPEIAFALAAGETLAPKKRPEGRAARREILIRLGYDPSALGLALGPRKGRWREDDLLDACILAHVARRRLAGEAIRLPDAPVRDARGFWMEIWG